MRSIATAALAVSFLFVGFALPAASEEIGITEAPEPNPDEPPARTHSDKVVRSKDPDLAPAYGPNPAKVRVVVFSDFQCPVCGRIPAATHQIAEEFPGDVRLEFYQMPLKMHRNAENAAVAALAAQRQGKFWEMHDLLFQNQGALDEESLSGYARQIGLDMAKFAKDYADPALRKRAVAERTLGETLGADGTPALFINGRPNVGWASWGALRSQVEMEVNAANGLIGKGTKLADVEAIRAKANLESDAKWKAYKAGIIDQSGNKTAKQ
jgi:protein-disulfide isomerase